MTNGRLCSWHVRILGERDLRGVVSGVFRTSCKSRMRVLSHANGCESVCYVAPLAEQVSSEMQRFFTWVNRRENVDGYVRAAIAVLWFLTIHPFHDGNGRVARALAEWMISNAERSGRRVYSMSFQILEEKKAYGKALCDAQHGSMDVTEWIVWFLGCLTRAMKAGRSLDFALRMDARAMLLHK